jgi:DNA polymerase V
VHLLVASSDTGKLIRAALAGLRTIWRDGYRYEKGGVLPLDLQSPQMSWIGSPVARRHRASCCYSLLRIRLTS